MIIKVRIGLSLRGGCGGRWGVTGKQHREMSGDNVLFLDLVSGYTSVCFMIIHYGAHLCFIHSFL